jgi:hypothetical protein
MMGVSRISGDDLSCFSDFLSCFKSFSIFNGLFLEFCRKMNYSQDEKQFVFFELAQIYGPVVHFYDGAIGHGKLKP